MRLGFLLKRGKPEARELAASIARVLKAAGYDTSFIYGGPLFPRRL